MIDSVHQGLVTNYIRMESATMIPGTLKSQLNVHIVGGGVAGLMTALDIVTRSRQLDLNVAVKVHEAHYFGGGAGERVAGPRSHLRLHTDGQLYAKDQPNVALALQQSTRRLQKLMPFIFSGVFTDPPRSGLALVFDPKIDGVLSLADFYDALGIWYKPVPLGVVKTWFPVLNFQSDPDVFRIRDSVIDISLMARYLMKLCHKHGVELLRTGVERLVEKNGHVHNLLLTDGSRITVSSTDQVVLACGAEIRPLLSSIGLKLEGLNLFVSYSIASPAFHLPAILIVHSPSGVNCTPQLTTDGNLLNIFGNTNRCELGEEYDGKPLPLDHTTVDKIQYDVREGLGLTIPLDGLQSWPAIKTEIVLEGTHSQSHHTGQVTGLKNAWYVIPGKLSQAATCSYELANIMCRSLCYSLDIPVARPIWDTPTSN